jgi:hypothetical protein
MRTGPYSDRVRAKLERMRGVRRPAAEKQKEWADITHAWRLAQRGHGWEDIKAACGVSGEVARRLVGLKHQTA